MDRNDFLDIFLEEAVDLLSDWERCCLDLENGYEKETLDKLFRSAHSLKGSSRSVGLEKFGSFVHLSEDLITVVRDKKVAITPELIKLLLETHSALSQWLEVVDSDPDYEPPEKNSILDRVQNALPGTSNEERNIGQILVDQGSATEEQIQVASQIQNRKIGEVLVDEGMVSKESVNQALSVQRKERGGNKVETLRVTTDKIDKLMQYIGELSTHLSIVWQARQNHTLESDTSRDAIYLCNKIIRDLQEQSLTLRMQTLQSLFQRLERAARDVARSKEREVNIETDGELVELDKTVIERIVDPFMHIIRNAVDHGIEPASVREQIGKPGRGHVKISAQQDAGRVNISVEDDGKGLDSERIREKAIEKGIVQPGDDLSEDMIYQLILKPGFSTAEKVTDISGRGVGLDVVSRSLEEVGGLLHISSKKGHGTSFQISLPTSLSIIEAFIVDVGGITYATPLQEVSEIINLSDISIRTSTDSGRMLSLREKVVPLQNLGDYLRVRNGKATTSDEDKPNLPRPALVTKTGSDYVAFEVGSIIGQQPVVVRNLSGQMDKIPGINGSTILADGEPGYIIGLSDIARSYIGAISRKASS